ncbi:MAG: RNA-binding protein hfq [Oscillatoriaceae bacterium SKW80]|nr:RNA-binding protein hfq [Oscillatoriaceae bacterium SKYG93]MCX8120984.1 RNA-binding protein hfq [Oscillatoriaceae bacterium SKW80]MDW8452257.1 RNA-binding protein hfq [Oscillatoriaceae cyanobacterium SKYGB_i_bin93]HIK26592.1 RNA-binding protein hfq [Oscillatoriaceae cyanobacterium M7585_C2015_266]
MTTFNTGLPSIRQIQALIKDKKQVEIKLVTADLLEGQIRWQDENCICLVDANNQSTFLCWQGIVYIKPKS